MEVKTKKEIIDRVVKFEIHDMNVDEVLDENGEFPKGSFGEEE